MADGLNGFLRLAEEVVEAGVAHAHKWGIRNGKGMMTHVISPPRRKRHQETVSDYCKQPIISTVQPKVFPGHHFWDPVPPVCLPAFLPDDLGLSR